MRTVVMRRHCTACRVGRGFGRRTSVCSGRLRRGVVHVAHEAEQQRALVGQQGGGLAIFGLATDDCRRDYRAMKARGVVFEGEPKRMPYGTGVLLQDLYGNKLYLNEDVP